MMMPREIVLKYLDDCYAGDFKDCNHNPWKRCRDLQSGIRQAPEEVTHSRVLQERKVQRARGTESLWSSSRRQVMDIVSACLPRPKRKIQRWKQLHPRRWKLSNGKSFVPICPEVFGGLTIPREPCERLGDRVVNKVGEDVTKEFFEGARRCWEAVLEKAGHEEIEGAILKARSPSCGSEVIYDGTFTGYQDTGRRSLHRATQVKGGYR